MKKNAMELNLDVLIGQNIERFRRRLGMTQEQVANYLGIKHPSLSYWENGTRPVPMKMLDKLADLFCTDVHTLMEENQELAASNAAFAFRAGEIDESDLKNIADFHKVIRDCITIKELRKKNQ